MLCLVRSLIL